MAIAEATISQQTQESPDPASLPTLDQKIFAKVRELMVDTDPTLLGKSIDQFLDYSSRMFEKLRLAVQNLDALAVSQIAHTLKSSTASYGASRLSGLCRELEALARADTRDSFADYLLKIEAEYENVRAALLVERDRE